MAQNIFDDQAFFEQYSRLPRSVGGLDLAPEWPSLRALLPDVGGARVLDLGCGFGWFCRWAAAAGAASVLGVDLSENMLARARVETSDPSVTFELADLESLRPEPGSFDLVYSSLTLHYVADLERLFATAHAALRPGGSFVWSAEHPIHTAPTSPGFIEHDGGPVWPLDGYLAEGPRTTNWLAPGVVKQHRTVGTYVTALLTAGFRLRALVEWAPSESQVAEHPDWSNERQRPPFLLVAATA